LRVAADKILSFENAMAPKKEVPSPKKKSRKKILSHKALLEIAAIAAAGIPLTTVQAAAYLQLAPGTLPVWRCHGDGPKFVLVGTSPRYLKTDLDAWIPSCRTQRRVSPNVGRPPDNKNRQKAVER